MLFWPRGGEHFSLMRLLLVGRNAQVGGGSTFRYNVGRGLRASGHEVAIAAGWGPMSRRYREAGLHYHFSPPYRAFVSRLAWIARRERCDLIHASNTTVGDIALAVADRLGVPLLVSLHNTIADHEARHPCLKRAGRIVVFDEGARASAAKFHSEFDPGKLVVHPRPVERTELRPETVSPLRLAYVGRLSSRKGRVALSVIEGFAALARDHPEADLAILGDGSMLGRVREEARRVTRSGAGTVRVLGRLLDPEAALRDRGVIIGAGYAALESLMRGRAVVGAGFHGFGPIERADLDAAVAANFGDTAHRWDMTGPAFAAAFRLLAAAWDSGEGRSRFWSLDDGLAARHSIEAVAARFEATYYELLQYSGGRS